MFIIIGLLYNAFATKGCSHTFAECVSDKIIKCVSAASTQCTKYTKCLDFGANP